MKTKLVVLDMAGTSVADDAAVAEAFQSAFNSHGYEVTIEEVQPLMGYKKTLAIQMLLERWNVAADPALIEDIHDGFVKRMIAHYESSPDVKPASNAEELLQWLKEKNIRVALNTGFPRVIADAIMQRLHWVDEGLVDEYIASDEVEKGRPHPFMIQKLMQSFSVQDPSDVVKVGDTEVDINEGRNAGCGLVVGVTTGAFTREKLQPYHPDHIIDDLSELPALIP